jgi:hypothetical protein
MTCFSTMCLTAPVLLTFVMTLSGPGSAAERKGSPQVDLGFTAADSAAGSVLQVPVLGYTTRQSPIELRPILGVPQSAALGAPIPLPSGITQLALAPGQDYALVQMGSARTVHLMPIGKGNAGDVVPIQGAFDAPDRIDFSPDGSVAALYSSQRQIVQLIGGLPQSPQLIGERAAIVSWGAVSAVAVSDDGEAVLLGSSDGESGAVTLLPAKGTPRTLLPVAFPSAVHFFPRTHDALLADSKGNQILLLKDTTGISAFSALAVEAQGVGAPGEMEISNDQKYALVVNKQPKSLLVIEIASGNVSSLTSALGHLSLGRIARNAGLFTSLREDGTAWLIGTAGTGAQISLLPNLIR